MALRNAVLALCLPFVISACRTRLPPSDTDTATPGIGSSADGGTTQPMVRSSIRAWAPIRANTSLPQRKLMAMRS